jgi:hypothetical protein
MPRPRDITWVTVGAFVSFWGLFRLYTPAVSQLTEVLEPDAVFVDPTGRRRRLVRNAGIVVGCMLAAYLVIVGFGLVTGTGVPLTPWPDVKSSHQAALPGNDGLLTKRGPSRPAGTRPSAVAAPSGAAPTARPTSAPGSRTTPTTALPVVPAPTATATQPGKGRAYGRTKSPHPKKS